VFSGRLPSRLEPNALTRAVDGARRSGRRLLDLTETNPTNAGISYPADVLSSLADPRGRQYRPDAQGLAEARQAIAGECSRDRAPVSPESLVLTAGTSEAYGLLFKLLCDPGDAVLVPRPSYPLFEMLARLEGIASRSYLLDWHGRWSIDQASLERALAPDVRAIVVVSPNNPTGSLLRSSDRDWLVGLAAERGLALIVDEVFADFPLAPLADACALSGEQRVLVFSLGGLSKSAGLPQLKLAWIAASGPAAEAHEAVQRLAVINDTYLSASTPVQVAAPRLLSAGRSIRAAIGARTLANLGSLREAIAGHPSVTLLEPEGGWSAVLQVPATQSEETLVVRLVEEAGVVVHPGYFFDFSHEAFLVVSLLPETGEFQEALGRLLGVAAGSTAS
jgi:aspartate/methionine/tyrosine aminotransferase